MRYSANISVGSLKVAGPITPAYASTFGPQARYVLVDEAVRHGISEEFRRA